MNKITNENRKTHGGIQLGDIIDTGFSKGKVVELCEKTSKRYFVMVSMFGTESSKPIRYSTTQIALHIKREDYEKSREIFNSDYAHVIVNPIKGTFTNTFRVDRLISRLSKEDLDSATKQGQKIIEYKCINDKGFEFINSMKLR